MRADAIREKAYEGNHSKSYHEFLAEKEKLGDHKVSTKQYGPTETNN